MSTIPKIRAGALRSTLDCLAVEDRNFILGMWIDWSRISGVGPNDLDRPRRFAWAKQGVKDVRLEFVVDAAPAV